LAPVLGLVSMAWFEPALELVLVPVWAPHSLPVLGLRLEQGLVLVQELVLPLGLALADPHPHTRLRYLQSKSCNSPLSWRTTSLLRQRSRGSNSHKHQPDPWLKDSKTSHRPTREMASLAQTRTMLLCLPNKSCKSPRRQHTMIPTQQKPRGSKSHKRQSHPQPRGNTDCWHCSMPVLASRAVRQWSAARVCGPPARIVSWMVSAPALRSWVLRSE